MGKLTSLAIAVTLAFFLVFQFSSAMYQSSPDVNRTTLQTYALQKSFTSGNVTLISKNVNASSSNTQLIAEEMQTSMTSAISDWEGGGILDKLAAGFGLISAITLNMAKLVLATLLDSVNFVFGIGMNLDTLPVEWRIFTPLLGLVVALVIIWGTFKVMGFLTGRDV